LTRRPGAGPGVRGSGRRLTIRDVARSAAVSPATVSNVLTGRRNVAPEVASRVLSVVDELGYRRDVLASALRSAKRTVVGAVVPELTNPFFAELVDRLESQARAADRRLLVAASGGDAREEERQIAALIAWRPAGVIVVPCNGRFAARGLLEQDGVPFVVVDRPLDDGPAVDTVAVDNDRAAEAGTRRLLELGHRRLLVVASSRRLGNMRERVDGALAAVAQVEGAVGEVIETGFAVEATADAVARRLDRSPRPTAVFALNNVLTLGTLKAVAARGLAVPDEISVLGFDDYDWMAVFRPPLSAVRQPVADLAHAAWERLAQRIGSAAAGADLAPCHVRLPCSLAWRGSVAPPGTSASAFRPAGEAVPS
jgi:LacI family transcriptional regulator